MLSHTLLHLQIGYLYKKGSFNTSLRYRLFVLRDKVLYYYKPTSTSSSATTTTTAKTLTNTNYTFAGYINIEGGRVYGEHKIAPNRKHPAHVFRIVTPGRVYVLSTGEEDEWQDWREAFEFISGVVVEDGSVFTAADWQELERGGGGDGGTESPVDGRTAAADSSDEGRTHGCIGGNIVKPHKIKLRLDFQKLGSPELEGILLKQGNDRMRKWRRRWFTLVGRSLFYGYVENRYEPIGTIPLSMCTLERGGEDTTSATSSTSALLSASHSSMNSAINAVPTSYAFDLVVRNEDLEQPVLRTYHLKVDDTDSFTYARWVRKLAVHTGASDARVRELLA